MFDISEKLFPNIITIVTQLGATGVIFLVYRKFVHNHVVAYLDAREQKMKDADTLAQSVAEEARLNKENLEVERRAMLDELDSFKHKLMKQANEIYDQRVDEARVLIEKEKRDFQKQMAIEKASMIEEVEHHAVSIAYEITKKTLTEFELNDAQMTKKIEKTLERS